MYTWHICPECIVPTDLLDHVCNIKCCTHCSGPWTFFFSSGGTVVVVLVVVVVVVVVSVVVVVVVSSLSSLSSVIQLLFFNKTSNVATFESSKSFCVNVCFILLMAGTLSVYR
jgi:hypothetical protein